MRIMEMSPGLFLWITYHKTGNPDKHMTLEFKSTSKHRQHALFIMSSVIPHNKSMLFFTVTGFISASFLLFCYFSKRHIFNKRTIEVLNAIVLFFFFWSTWLQNNINTNCYRDPLRPNAFPVLCCIDMGGRYMCRNHKHECCFGKWIPLPDLFNVHPYISCCMFHKFKGKEDALFYYSS